MTPALLLIVPGEAARAAMESELARYQRDYRLESFGDAEAALGRLALLRAGGHDVAMVLADLGLPSPGGIEVLRRARTVAPTARRVLLLDWGLHPDQVSVVAPAVSLGLVDTALAKPTGPRDESFHAAITEDLREWAWTTTPVVMAVKLVGPPDHPRVEELHELLGRLGVPNGVCPPASPEGERILALAGPGAALPVLEIMGSAVLAGPTNRELAAAFGATVDVGATTYDLAVVGAGPAGLAAAVYGASEGLQTLVIEGRAYGGQAGTSSMIRNYLGFHRGVTGRELGERAVGQAIRFGAAFDLGRAVVGLAPGTPHRLELADGAVATARAVVLACGVTYRRLGVPALEALVGSGVFYGSPTTHARDLTGLPIAIVGAGNSGGQAALHLAKYASAVTLLARGPDLRATMSDYLVREIEADGRIAVRVSTEIADGGGDDRLEWLELADRNRGQRSRLVTSALFVLIGAETDTGWMPPSIQRDGGGYVLTGNDVERTGWPLARPPLPLETSAPGVFAAGDVRANGVKRVAAAVGEGSVSVPMVHRYLAET